MATTDARYVLYGDPMSGNAYKTALMLALTKTPFEFREILLRNGDHLKPEFLKLNPLGKVPVLVHGDLVLRQSHDTLRYLSEQTGQLGPKDWTEEARIGDWIGFTVDFVSYGLARLRFERKFGSGDEQIIAYFQPTTDRGLGILESHLASNEWLACGRLTIADIAVFPAATFLTDAGYDFGDFPGIGAWRDRIAALPGFGWQQDLLKS